jgi:hypothetical protein
MIILIIALVLLWSHPAWAVPVFDAANATTITEVDTVSTSITVAGTNRLMIGCATFNADRSISSFTYNSVGLTSVLSDFVATRQETAMYRLIAPDTGTHNLTVLLDQAAGDLTVGGMSFTGAHQTVPLDTAVSDADLTEASATVAPSSATTDLVAGCFGKEGVAATAGDTSRASAGTLSLVTQTGAASVTLDWSWADSFQYWAAVGVSINPVATQRPIPPQVWQ